MKVIRLKYQPLPSQAKFHRMRSTYKGFSGPVGSGKTEALVMEAIRMASLNSGRTGLLCAPTHRMLRDVTLATLKSKLEEHRIEYEMRSSYGCISIRDFGSKILLRSLEQFEHLRGVNLAWFGVDELTYATESAWERLVARLRDPKAKRREGFAAWTPRGFDWVYRRFIDEPKRQYKAVIARPFENRHLIEAAPEYYRALESTYSLQFYKQEVLGEYGSLTQERVYNGFDKLASVRPVELDQNRPVCWGIDFNVNPMCSIIAQRQGTTLDVIDEIVIENSSTLEACREFRARFGLPRGGLIIYGDASGNNRKTSGPTDYQVIKTFFQDAGMTNVTYRVPRANPEVRARVEVVNGLLCNAAGERRMSIHPRCRELIRDFEEVHYKQGTHAVDKDRDPRRTHLSDALGYLVWQEFALKGGYGERNQPLF